MGRRTAVRKTPARSTLGYPGGMRSSGRNAPDEPWYDGGDYTLLAAPRKITDGRLGSKLHWPEVREALWEIYQPFRDVKVHIAPPPRSGALPAEEELVSFDRVPAATFAVDARAPKLERARHLLVGYWYRPDNTTQAFRVTPTLARYLSACLGRYGVKTGPVALDELPDNFHSLLELPGGIAVITEQGAFLLDSGRHDRLDVVSLKEEFRRALCILHRLETTERGTRALLEEARACFAGGRRNLSQEDLLRRLSLEQVEIALELHEARTAPRTSAAQQFREALLARWGIGNWLELDLARHRAYQGGPEQSQ